MSYMIGERLIRHIAIYLRISQEKRNENVETLENHRQILTEFAKNNGMSYVEFGEVVSGGKTELVDRPQLKKLLANIEQFDAILVVELSRLSRNGLISQTVKQYCIDYDKPILTPYGQIYDLSNVDNDRLMFDVGAMISSHEHGVIGKRSKTNKIQMAKQGLHVSGGVPFGYSRNPKTKTLEVVEEEAKIVRYIFHLHSKGLGTFKIRDILNEEGYKTARGSHFEIPTVKRIIRNITYKGWTFFNDRKRIKKNGKITHEIVNTIIVKDTHPAIISPEEWDLVNKDRMERAENSRIKRENPYIKTGITLLKDLVFCSICGKKMLIRKDMKDKVGYTVKKCEAINSEGDKCKNCGIKLEFLEKRVLRELARYKSKLEAYLKLLEEQGDSQVKQDKQFKLNQISKRLKEVVSDQKKLIDLALSGLFTNEELSEKKQELMNLKTLLESQRDSLLVETDMPDIENTIERVKEIIETIDLLPTLDSEIANQKLKLFIQKINYKREIPEELLKKSTRNTERKMYPFEIQIDYYQI